jgi:hypothetical protein
MLQAVGGSMQWRGERREGGIVETGAGVAKRSEEGTDVTSGLGRDRRAASQGGDGYGVRKIG